MVVVPNAKEGMDSIDERDVLENVEGDCTRNGDNGTNEDPTGLVVRSAVRSDGLGES